MLLVMLDLIVLRIRLFQHRLGLWLADEGGERTGDFSKPVALRGLDIAFGLTITNPSGVRAQHAIHNGAQSAPPVRT